MPLETYGLEYIATALGLSSVPAARKRINAIRDILEKRGYIVYDHKHGNALMVTLDGLNLLQRANDLPGSLAKKAAQLRKELGDPSPSTLPGGITLGQNMRRWRVQHRDEHKDLERRIDELERRLETLEKRRWWNFFGRSNNAIEPPPKE